MGDEPLTTGSSSEPSTRQASRPPFPLVGIGASAGGLEAARAFFETLPADPGVAFVLIMHLAPERESHLSEVIRTSTAMDVLQVADPVEIRPNCVYVISPGQPLTLQDGHLIPQPKNNDRVGEAVIDCFFRSLAAEWKERAIGIVLSGTGSDGALGIRAIREVNGLTMAQQPDEAKFPSMPAHAIDTGHVDIVVPAGDLGRRLLRVRQSMDRLQVPAQEASLEETDEQILEQILVRVRTETDHDFSGYKRSTVLRRIARRMQANGIDSLKQYLDYIRENAVEPKALFRDLLISVTNFFRDPEAYESLAEKVLPELLAEKAPGENLRVWVAGCATGEEAFSLAILLQEAADQTEKAPEFQVFATDVDDEAIVRARQGVYPESIAVDVSQQRLDRFFIPENGHYRVRKSVRDSVLFAAHDLLRDPPFSNMDLISCRNLLIYLERERQKPVFEMFHFALSPGGYLFFGPSESAETAGDLFTAIDKKQSIYRRRPGTTRPQHFSKMIAARSVPVGPAAQEEDSAPADVSYDERHRELLYDQCAPTSILVREDHTVVHVAKEGSRFLQYPKGQLPHSILDIVPGDLRSELRSALFQLFKKDETSEKTVRLMRGESEMLVRLVVQPVDFDEDMAQVRLEEVPEPVKVPLDRSRSTGERDEVIERLEEELEDTRAELQSTIEEYETSTQELRASNEELMSMNEEFQSTTEELETGREELQSMNEELSTVNHELERKIDELERANSDLENFITAADLGTIFLDRDMCVRRYTPRVTDLFNLIESDIGRSISHITNNLQYEGLLSDAKDVFARQTVLEREVRTEEGSWYIMRLRPYRTVEDEVSGVVFSFFDITRRREAEEELQKMNQELEERVEERTEELEEANEKLKEQMAERGRLEREVLNISEQERWRLGESLHDDLGQQLTGIEILADTIAEKLGEENLPHAKGVNELRRQIKEADRQVDALVSGIIPVALDEKGIVPALADLAGRLEEGYDLRCVVDIADPVTIPDNTRATHLYRIAQEATLNAAQHGEASEVGIRLFRDDDQLVLEITDDGLGLDRPIEQLAEEGMGIRLMRYRCHLMGGTFTAESTGEAGTRFLCSVPIE